MKLVSIYDVDNNIDILLSLLLDGSKNRLAKNRTKEDLEKYVNDVPFREWNFIIDDSDEYVVGDVYLTYQGEIYSHIFRSMKGRGHASFAMSAMILRYPDTHLKAVIDQHNKAAIALYSSLGFEFTRIILERPSSVGEQ